MPKSKLDEELTRRAAVQVLLALRALHLANGANPMTHWTQLQDRMRAAARTQDTAARWATKIQSDLRIQETDNSLSLAICELAAVVGSDDVGFLTLVEAEHAYLIALARQESEHRQQRRKDAAERRAKEKDHAASQD